MTGWVMCGLQIGQMQSMRREDVVVEDSVGQD